MYKCIAVTLMLVVVTCVSAAARAAGFSSLEERMSQKDFQAAGLNKLTPAELKVLDNWLRAHYKTTTTVTTRYVSPSGKPVFYPKENERKTVESRIDGKFYGWRGHTVFTLENGEQWTQAESGRYSIGPYDHPKVKIKPMILGSWLMYVEPCGCSLRVQRTK